MPCYEFEGLIPVVAATAYVHPTAVLIGDVIIEDGVYVGPGASLRGDFGRLILKKGANLQDNCIMHGYCEFDTVVEEGGHIGHGAILHSCVIKKNALIGMNSVVMDGAVIEQNCIVAAMSFVKTGYRSEANQLIVGSPAKVIRQLTEQDLVWKKLNTLEYQNLAQRSKSMRLTEPLTEVENNRPRLSGTTSVQPK